MIGPPRSPHAPPHNMPHTEVNPPPPTDRLRHFPHLESEAHHPSAWPFPASLAASPAHWLACLRELYAMPISFPASLSPDAGMLLHALVKNLRPRVIVEVGTFCSVSTHWIAGALLEAGKRPGIDAVIHCIDDFTPIEPGPWRDAAMPEGRLEFVRARLTRAGLIDYVRLHQGNSSYVVTDLQEQLTALGGVDLAFLDGDHGILGATSDFLAVEPVLNTGGYVLLHDTFPDQCGGYDGPRYILDHVRTRRNASPDPHANPGRHAKPAPPVDEIPPDRKPLGQGIYDRVDLYLSPLNYGMGLLRRLE